MDTSTRTPRRQGRSPQQWDKIVDGWLASGLSAEGYAKSHDVGVGGLWKWSRRLGKARSAAKPKSPLDRSATASPAPKFLAVQVAEPKNGPMRETAGPCGIEIEWPSGPVVRLSFEVPPSTIEAVVRAVSEAMSC